MALTLTFRAISGFSLLPVHRELGWLLWKEGAGRRSWCGQGSTRSVPEKVGLLCKRELVLRNPFHELSSPDLLLQREGSHTKAFSPKQKYLPPAPALPGHWLWFPDPLREWAAAAAECWDPHPGISCVCVLGAGHGPACVQGPQCQQSPCCCPGRDQGGSTHPTAEQVALALLPIPRNTQ